MSYIIHRVGIVESNSSCILGCKKKVVVLVDIAVQGCEGTMRSYQPSKGWRPSAPSPRELAQRPLPRLKEGFLSIVFQRDSAVPFGGQER